LAFSTVTGSNGVTSLVGTTGVDTATVVTLDSNVFVGGNTGNDTLITALGTGGNNLSSYNVRMGGGDDQFTANNTLLNSFVSLDGETLANDGNDTYTGGGSLIISSEIVGRGGNDTFTGMNLNGSTLNGNTGIDTITLGSSATSFVYGGADTDTITVGGNSSALLVNGNKGTDNITVNNVTFSSSSVYGGAGNDTITVNSTTDGILVSGDKGVDNITTAGGDDTINGGDNNDTIIAAAGVDTIDGGAGNDAITGGTGADVIAGGAGNDVFTIGAGDAALSATAPSSGFDTISDFVANTQTVAAGLTGDRINFATATGAYTAVAGAVSGGVSLTADLAAQEVAGTAFGGANNDYMGTTITGAVAWAGNYIVYDTDNNGVVNAGDDVVKVNTLTGITAATTLNI